MLRTAAVISAFLGLGFGLLDIFGIVHLARGKGVWMFMGWPTYDGVLPGSVSSLIGFLAVTIAEVWCGVLLWRRSRSGIILSWVVLPFEFLFWIGFALPVGPPLGLARAAMVVLGRRTVRHRSASSVE